MSRSSKEISISIDFDGHGHWTIDQGPEHVTCDTLQDARRIARQRASTCADGELVVRDAYHRVIERERLTPARRAAAGR